MLEPIIPYPFNAMSGRRERQGLDGSHWELGIAATASLCGAWAPVVEKYLRLYLPEYPLEAMALVTTAIVIGPKIVNDQKVLKSRTPTKKKPEAAVA